MQLILMRHAIAEERSARYADDALRPLNKGGEKKHRLVSEGMRRMGIDFDELVSSPLVRARQTADITAEVYGWESDIVETDVLGAGYSPAALNEFLGGYDETARVLCVGHEPDLSEYAAHLLHPSGDVEIAFRKSAVLGLDLPEGPKAGAAVLLYFLKPGHLARLARQS
jgi:phosphohistidine phosphatase